jgi:hypothetical protein
VVDEKGNASFAHADELDLYGVQEDATAPGRPELSALRFAWPVHPSNG